MDIQATKEAVNTLSNVQSINRLSFEQKGALSLAYRNRSELMNAAMDKGIDGYNVYLLGKVDIEAFNAVSKSLSLIRYNLKTLRFGKEEEGNYADIILKEYHNNSINGIEVLNLMFETGLIDTPYQDILFRVLSLNPKSFDSSASEALAPHHGVRIEGTLERYFTALFDACDRLKTQLRIKRIEFDDGIGPSLNPSIAYRDVPYWEFRLFTFDSKEEQADCVNNLVDNDFVVSYSIPEYGKNDLDLTIPEVMSDIYGLRPYLNNFACNRKRLIGGGNCFNRKEIGEEKYNSVMASASRLLKRLEQRGLCYREKRQSKLWVESGIRLTDKGLELSKALFDE